MVCHFLIKHTFLRYWTSFYLFSHLCLCYLNRRFDKCFIDNIIHIYFVTIFYEFVYFPMYSYSSLHILFLLSSPWRPLLLILSTLLFTWSTLIIVSILTSSFLITWTPRSLSLILLHVFLLPNFFLSCLVVTRHWLSRWFDTHWL